MMKGPDSSPDPNFYYRTFYDRTPKNVGASARCVFWKQKARRKRYEAYDELVRLKGFEPPTYWFVASHSIQLSYSRIFCFAPFYRGGRRRNKKAPYKAWSLFGTAEGIRTPDLLVRSQSLYPTELQPHFSCVLRLSVERYVSITQEK